MCIRHCFALLAAAIGDSPILKARTCANLKGLAALVLCHQSSMYIISNVSKFELLCAGFALADRDCDVVAVEGVGVDAADIMGAGLL